MRSNREIRIAIYSVFIGALIALVAVQLYSTRSEALRQRKEERARRQEERFRDMAASANEARLEALREKEKERQVDMWETCPRCPDPGVGVPETLHKFVDEHMKNQKGSPLVILKAKTKGLPSYYLSTHPKDKDQETRYLLTGGYPGWQERIKGRLCNLMKNSAKGSLFVDVGAYVGTIALSVAACGHKVAAFEPHPQNFRLLQESAALNNMDSEHLMLYNMALGNRTGTTCLSASSSDHSNAKIPPTDPNNPLYCKEAQVDINRLDDVIKSAHVRILHIDVRGFEPAVIAGAQKILTREVPPKFIFFTVEQIYSKSALGTTIEYAALIDWLMKFGYTLTDTHHEPITSGKKFLAKLGYDQDYVMGVFDQQEVPSDS